SRGGHLLLGLLKPLPKETRTKPAAICQVGGAVDAIGRGFGSERFTAGNLADRHQRTFEQILDRGHANRTVRFSVFAGKVKAHGTLLLETDQYRTRISAKGRAVVAQHRISRLLDDVAGRKPFDVIKVFEIA